MNDSSHHAGPLDMLWSPPAVASVVLVGLAVAAILSLTPGLPGDRLAYFGLAALMLSWIGLGSLAALYGLRRQLARRGPYQVAWSALGCLLVTTWAAGLAAHALVPALAASVDLTPWLVNLGLMSLAVGGLAIAAFHTHWRNRELALRTARAELESLQARVRPHFLFNTLNTGIALVHQRPEAAEELLLDLADLFRAALAAPEMIPLSEELALTRRYADIESLRFGERLQLDWEVPDPVPEVQLPRLSLQPLVENAILHGVEPAPEGGTVRVRVVAGNRTVEVGVYNDISSWGPERRQGHSIGLESVRARIQALGTGRARLEVFSNEQVYRVCLVLPLEGHALRQPPPGSTDGTPR